MSSTDVDYTAYEDCSDTRAAWVDCEKTKYLHTWVEKNAVKLMLVALVAIEIGDGS